MQLTVRLQGPVAQRTLVATTEKRKEHAKNK